MWARIGLDKQDDDTLLKLWTIGVNPAAASDKEAPPDEEEEAKDDGVWFPVELDVPGERSGRMPYQALMNFNKSEGGQQRGRFGEMFKVQVAQGAPPNSPMLMYNKERTRKTFIHADAPGYEEIGAAVSRAHPCLFHVLPSPISLTMLCTRLCLAHFSGSARLVMPGCSSWITCVVLLLILLDGEPLGRSFLL